MRATSARGPGRLRRLDRWLLVNHPDTWAGRTHLVLVGYPLAFGIAYSASFFLGADLDNIPAIDSHLPIVLSVLAVVALAWAVWLGRLQGETPLRRGVEGWSTPLRLGLAFVLIALLGFGYTLGVHHRIEGMVSDDEFRRDNEILRSVDFRVDGSVGQSRRVGLSIAGLPDTMQVYNVEEAGSERLDLWVSVLDRYSEDDDIRLRSALSRVSTGLRDGGDAALNDLDVAAYEAVENLSSLAVHLGYGGSTEYASDPELWALLVLLALYVGFVFDYVVTLAPAVTGRFAVVGLAGATGVLFAIAALTAAVLDSMGLNPSSSLEVPFSHGLGLHVDVPFGVWPFVVSYLGLVIPAFALWFRRRQGAMRKGMLWLSAVLTPPVFFMAFWNIENAHSSWQMADEGALVACAVGLAFLVLFLLPARVILNNILAAPR